MLHITHRQTTANHPVSNGAVKRLHRHLKDALSARIVMASWAKEIPWVLLGLCAQPREDTGLSPAEAVFGAPIVLPNEFLKGDKISVDTISKYFLKSLDAPAFSLPRHNLSRQLPSILPPLHPLYDNPYAVLRWGPCAFTFRCQAARGDHCCEPPQGMHGCGCHAWQPQMPHQTARPQA